MNNSRRFILKTSVLASAAAVIPFSQASALTSQCSLRNLGVRAESNDSPFFEHYHQFEIPVSALITIPKDGIIVKSSTVDQGSYDLSAFDKFIKSSGLKRETLQAHSHDVLITANQLSRIASGERDVEIRVISKAGNYVHNFLVSASPMMLARVRKGRK